MVQPDANTIARAKLYLHKSVAENRIENIVKILSAAFPIEEEVGPGGLTILMHCAQSGTVECLDALLKFNP
jgi:hypothetical protein